MINASTVAGFIVWLAHQHLPPEIRRGSVACVESFLAWRDQQRAHGAEATADAYLAELRGGGASEASLARRRAALGLFRNYLLSSDREPRSDAAASGASS